MISANLQGEYSYVWYRHKSFFRSL
jgi:hypothetical protein